MLRKNIPHYRTAKRRYVYILDVVLHDEQGYYSEKMDQSSIGTYRYRNIYRRIYVCYD